jgi:flagellar biosynthesis protein FliP
MSSTLGLSSNDSLSWFVILSLLSFLPAVIVSCTSFIRTIIVLSMVRQGLGMPETPPNVVLVGLGLFMTVYVMSPTFDTINANSLQPLLKKEISVQVSAERAIGPLHDFMIKQVRPKDLELMYVMAKKEMPQDLASVSMVQLVPAFVLNELRVAFQIGFLVLLPFLLIDLLVAIMLLALGMMMVPPATISLPLKVLLFVLIDGWSLLLQGLVGSFK